MKLNTPRQLAPPSDRSRVGTPPSRRTRITEKHRAQAIDLYVGGMSAVDVGQEVGVGKATVLRTLQDASVPNQAARSSDYIDRV